MNNKKLNPVEKLLDDISKVTEDIQNSSADFMFGVLNTEARNRISTRLIELKKKKSLLEAKLPKVMSFFNDFVDIKTGSKTKQHPSSKKLRDSYKYFNRVLQPHEFQYPATELQTCDLCGKEGTSRTGVVFTFDPSCGELLYICDYCHIDRNQNKNNVDNK